MPILEDISQMSDSGSPFVISLPEEVPVVQVYKEIAQKTHEEVKKLDEGNEIAKLEARYDPILGKILIEELQNKGQAAASPD